MPNPVSTANVFGHPIHPMLIPFPIAFFVGAFACDLAYLINGAPIWATASLWLIGAGLVMAALAAIAGLTDFIGDGRIRNIQAAWLHAIGNVAVVLIQAFSFFWRYRYGTAGVLPLGLILSFATVGMLLFTGWMGWEMVYRHRVAVYDAPPAPAEPSASKPPHQRAA
ncbi:MAG: DUF2231 domain-containing protein [Xanthobacteraceae bacterium]